MDSFIRDLQALGSRSHDIYHFGEARQATIYDRIFGFGVPSEIKLDVMAMGQIETGAFQERIRAARAHGSKVKVLSVNIEELHDACQTPVEPSVVEDAAIAAGSIIKLFTNLEELTIKSDFVYCQAVEFILSSVSRSAPVRYLALVGKLDAMTSVSAFCQHFGRIEAILLNVSSLTPSFAFKFTVALRYLRGLRSLTIYCRRQMTKQSELGMLHDLLLGALASPLHHFVLSWEHVEPGAAENAVKCIKTLCCCSSTLQTVDIDVGNEVEVGPTLLDDLSPQIRELKITGLNFTGPLGEDSSIGVRRGGTHGSGLRLLKLHSSRLGMGSVQLLQRFPRIESLEVDSCDGTISESLLSLIVRCLPDLRAIKVESLNVQKRDHTLFEEVMGCVASELQFHRSLSQISVTNNTFYQARNERIEALFPAIYDLAMRSKETLYLAFLNVFNWDIANLSLLASGLNDACNKSLKSIELFVHEVGNVLQSEVSADEAFGALFQAVRTFQGIEVVDLTFKNATPLSVDSSSGHAIRRLLESTTTLRRFALGHCEISEAFVQDAIEGLKKNQSLEEFALEFRVNGPALGQGAVHARIVKALLDATSKAERMRKIRRIKVKTIDHLGSAEVADLLNDASGDRIVDIFRHDNRLEECDVGWIYPRDGDQSPTASRLRQIDNFLRLNRYGRRYLDPQRAAPGLLWARILSRTTRRSRTSGAGDASAVYYVLRGLVGTVGRRDHLLRRGTRRSRPAENNDSSRAGRSESGLFVRAEERSS
jgi:hypothetical protein